MTALIVNKIFVIGCPRITLVASADRDELTIFLSAVYKNDFCKYTLIWSTCASIQSDWSNDSKRPFKEENLPLG